MVEAVVELEQKGQDVAPLKVEKGSFVQTDVKDINGSSPKTISDQENFEIITVSIPQGSAASQISSILDSTGVITSKLAF